MDGRKKNHGTIGNKGGGRKKMPFKRKAHSVYAFESEWQLIKKFSKFVRQDFDGCAKFISDESEALKPVSSS